MVGYMLALLFVLLGLTTLAAAENVKAYKQFIFYTAVAHFGIGLVMMHALFVVGVESWVLKGVLGVSMILDPLWGFQVIQRLKKL